MKKILPGPTLIRNSQAKLISCVILLVFTYQPIYAQEKIESFYLSESQIVCERDMARYKQTTYYADSTVKDCDVTIIDLNTGKAVSRCNYKRPNRKTSMDVCKFYYPNGQLRLEEARRNDTLDGHMAAFYSDGKLKRSDDFKDGKLIAGECYSSDGSKIDYFDYYASPKYLRGDSLLGREISGRISYPMVASYSGIDGYMLLKMIISKEGKVGDIFVDRSAHPILDNLVIKELHRLDYDFSPAMEDGEKVQGEYYFVYYFWSYYRARR